jgi:membrane associated rhomboid family serine protease
MTSTARPPRPPAEPAFNAPWPPLLLAVLILGGYGVQGLVFSDARLLDLALSPLGLAEGRWWTLASSLFIHGGWLHAFLNAAFALAFGTPVARLLGLRATEALAFFFFYLLCGAFAGVGYSLVHAGSAAPLVGASGAVSGLMGAASRTMDRGGALGPLISPSVVSTAAAWVIVNLIIALAGLTLGAGAGGVAWEAHLVGFAAGVLLIGPTWRLTVRRAPA